MFSRLSRIYPIFFLAVLVVSGCFAVQAQESDQPKSDQSPAASTSKSKKTKADDQQDPLKRERPKDNKAATAEKLSGVYKKWLDHHG